MFKKLLLSTLIVAGILWAAGYDFGWMKHDALELASDNAAELSGRNTNDDWGD